MSSKKTLKGFRDFLPETMAVRNEVIKRLREVFEKYGYDEIQTPTLEYQKVLLGKYGDEADRLVYAFEDKGKRKVGLKYDLTVPLARTMASNQNLPIPFRRYQIQPVFRADKPQKGRYREVYQCDIDIVGSASPTADAEILAIISGSLKALEFSEYEIRVNSRKVLFDVLRKSGVDKDKWLTATQSIDKLDKYPESKVISELQTKGLTKKMAKQVLQNIKYSEPDQNLVEVISLAESLGASNISFTPTLSRGLDYYTGAIFETIVTKPNIGSITGGGRYDNLIEDLGGPSLPAVGTSIGLDRVCDVITELELWSELPKTVTKVLVVVLPGYQDESIKIASQLRIAGINTELFPDPETKLSKQLKYADKKVIPWILIVGEKEIKDSLVTIKNMKNKSQETLSLSDAVSRIKQ
jgi:histidyl-tRNA synthetase